MRTPDERKGRTALPEETNDPAQVAAFVVLAEQGERLEPNNAFFPAMVAWGQFAGRRDDAATQAWLRAGTKPVFDEHDTEEITARWELNRAMNHGMETGAISRMFTQGAITYPHFAVLRSVARMASYTAWQRERRGDREGGFVIRRASRQVGQTIQYTSKSHISPVGEAMVQITSNRATETERLIKNPYKDPDSDKRWSDEKNVRYAGYLRSIGHPDEATAFMGAVAERERLQALRNAVSSQTYWGLDKKTFQWLGMWSVGYLLLAGVLFCLVFAGLFKLVYRFSPRLQNGEPLQASARWGVATGLTLPVVAGLVALSSIGLWLEPQVGMIAGFVVAALALVAPPVLLRLGWRGWGHGLLVAGATLVALAALVATGAACYLPAKSITDSFGYHGAGGMPTDAAAQAVEQTVVPVIIGLCVASVPLSLLALFGVFSKMLRVPFAAGVTRGMRAMAVPLAALLLLLWVGAFSVTLRHETAAIREMRAMVSVGEMQYLRSLGK